MDVLTQLMRDEGLRLSAYPDPLTGGAPWTIGYGCTGKDIVEGTVWTQEQAYAELVQRVSDLHLQLAQALPWFGELLECRRAVLINMAYQLGVAGLLGFHATLTMVQERRYAAAHDLMLNSLWAQQTPLRAKRLALQMALGVWQ